MTQKQIKLVRVLLFKEGIPDQEEDMAYRFSKTRSTSLKDLDHSETQALIADLNGKSPTDAMSNKIISMAHEMHWKLKTGKVDMDRLNAWCIKHTTSHKPLNQIPKKDLPIVVSVFTKMYHEFLKSI